MKTEEMMSQLFEDGIELDDAIARLSIEDSEHSNLPGTVATSVNELKWTKVATSGEIMTRPKFGESTRTRQRQSLNQRQLAASSSSTRRMTTFFKAAEGDSDIESHLPAQKQQKFANPLERYNKVLNSKEFSRVTRSGESQTTKSKGRLTGS